MNKKLMKYMIIVIVILCVLFFDVVSLMRFAPAVAIEHNREAMTISNIYESFIAGDQYAVNFVIINLIVVLFIIFSSIHWILKMIKYK